MTAVDLEHEFDAAAPRYDLMVSLNPGYHDHLRSAADTLAGAVPAGDGPLLDVGCGSGASTAALVAAVPPATRIQGTDASAGMIDQARAKTWPDGVSFEHRKAEDLDEPADSVRGALACYLFRNLDDPDAVLADLHRSLVPGGCLVVQDYSVAGSRWAQLRWGAVCWLIVIPLSLVLTRRTRLYRYLWHSVLRFDSIPRFEARLRAAGFVVEQIDTVGGWQHGILHTVLARRA